MQHESVLVEIKQRQEKKVYMPNERFSMTWVYKMCARVYVCMYDVLFVLNQYYYGYDYYLSFSSHQKMSFSLFLRFSVVVNDNHKSRAIYLNGILLS